MTKPQTTKCISNRIKPGNVFLLGPVRCSKHMLPCHGTETVPAQVPWQHLRNDNANKSVVRPLQQHQAIQVDSRLDC